MRLDIFEQSFRERISRSQVDQAHVAASPRAGLVYRPLPELAFFTNVGTSFRPNIGPDAAAVTRGAALPPETGLGYEVGAKSELFGGNLLLTAAAFHVERENVLTPDPANSGFSLAAGAVRSQGFELTAQGQITPELKLLAGYVYADARVTRDNVLPVGAPLVNVPRHSGSLLAVYEPGGEWRGFGIGGGVRGVGERAGDAAGTGFTLPGFIAVDALTYYKFGNARVALNVENIFDTAYYESSLNVFRVYPGSPGGSPAPSRCASDGGGGTLVTMTDAGRPARILSIDALRGLVMLLMLVDHVRDFFYLHMQVRDPMDLATTTPGLFLTRATSHLCAPVFILLTGLSASLYGQKHGTRATAAFLLKRGLLLVVLEVTLVSFAWTGTVRPPIVYLQVIWVIGLSMMALAALLWLPRALLVACALALMLGHNLLDGVVIRPDEPGYGCGRFCTNGA